MRPCSIGLSVACCWLAVGAGATRAQLLPFAPNWPIAPTDPKQCATFAADLNKYEREVQKQHQDCLDAPGKVDRPNLPPNSPLCSKFACQILHDRLFSDSDLNSVKVLRKRVDSCFAQAKEYQDQQAAQKREAEEREQADNEQVAKDQESAENRRKAQQEERSRPERTRISPTPASQSPANNPAVLPPSQQTGQPYTVDSLKVPDTPETEQARQAAKEREQKELNEQTLNELADPFGKSGKSASANTSATASDGVVDPFGNSQPTVSKDSAGSGSGLVNPFANTDSGGSDKEHAKHKALEIGWDETSKMIEKKSDEAIKTLDKNLEEAELKLNPSQFKAYKAEIVEAEAYLKGLNRVVQAAPFLKDAWEASSDFNKGWNDFAHDCESKGFEIVLKRLSPQLSNVWEGPVGWAAAITFDSSSTQTPKQDFDPMTAINEPSRYSFDERVAALQRMYLNEARYPEVWKDANRQLLRELTLQVYNSPDNPNIHLAPQ